MVKWGRVEGMVRDATGAISRFFSFFSVQGNEVKSNLIAITGDNSGDTEKGSLKRK